MKPISRRQFLLSLLAGASAVAISACDQKKPGNNPVAPTSDVIANPTIQNTNSPSEISNPTTSNPTTSNPTTPNPTASNPATPKPATPNSPPTETLLPVDTSAPGGSPDLVVAHGGDDPETLVRRAIAALGGMEQFVQKGAKVVIKPNICTAYHSYEYASTTNPWVVAALVKLCLEVGAGDVSVMDYPFGGTAEQAYVISGIREQVQAAGGKMVEMSSLKFSDTPIPNGKKITKWPVYEDVLKADAFINVPIAKDHNLTRLTLGMKNLMGVVQNRERLHAGIGQRLADLTSLIYPTLTVVDSIRILMSGGPTGGNLDAVKKLDTIIAGKDIVAADSYAAGFFNIKPEDISYIKAGAAMGLGRSDVQNLKVEDIAVGG